MKRFRGWIIAALLVALAAGGYLWATGRLGRGAPPTPPTVAVQRGDVAQTVLASGQVEAIQLVSVGARVSGQIETLAASLGQEVKEGDLIAQIDSQDQQNEVAQKQAAVANLNAQIAGKQADLRKAELTLTRQQRLGKSDWSSQETVESAQADVDVLKADLDALAAQKKSAEIDVATAQLSLERTKITAPISGTVVAVSVQQGQTLNSLQSAPTIVKIANLDRVLVKAEISEADVVNVKAGQPVSFTILGEPGQTYKATLRDVEPAPEGIEDSDTISTDEAIYYNGRFEVDNPDHKLRIGMTTQVTITRAEAKGVLTFPSNAVRTQDGNKVVDLYDAASGRISPRKVTVGLDDKITAEITDGLKEGDRVVLPQTAAAASSGGSSSRGGRMGPPPMGL